MTAGPVFLPLLPGAADLGAPGRVGSPSAAAVPAPDASGFASALDAAFGSASAALERADGAERAALAGTGGITEMALERARADVALSIAGTVASRTSQALSTLLGMQI